MKANNALTMLFAEAFAKEQFYLVKISIRFPELNICTKNIFKILTRPSLIISYTREN